MQTAKLKTYAPKARRDFIAAVTRRAAKFGLSDQGASPVRAEGQVVIIEGQPYPQRIAVQRDKLARRIAQQGFAQVMEAAAYTWFNRFAAIRYMELHGYLEHSFRVLSHPGGSALPEILEHAQHLDLPGLDRARVMDLKLDGTRDEELYRDLLLAQCRALHQAMPFLFESVDDETELLLPENLLQTDSLIRELVTAIPEDNWREIEIIGWLYQFYISEKKDQVIGKVVKSEDIPAATQLFTPNWIVKYMVQNSLGAQWLATYPDSPLKGQMAYYIEPAEQTEEVAATLAAITPSTLNPEELTLIDPACGSGHILVEAYELFKAIYLERGYRQRDVPRLILEKNLYGLDIDGRAAQLSGFALMMKGRADDRRLLERGVTLNVMALVDSAGFDAEGLSEWVGLREYGLQPGDLTELKRLSKHARTFGSLIQVSQKLAAKLPALKRLCETESKDLFISDALRSLDPLVQQAAILAARYDAVVGNPPFMGNRDFGSELKSFLKSTYKTYDKNLFSAFIIRGRTLALHSGLIAYVTPFVWLFISSYESLRRTILTETSVKSVVKPSYTAFFDVATVQFAAFVLCNQYTDILGSYLDLGYLGSAESQPLILQKILREDSHPDRHLCLHRDFLQIPGITIAFWTSPRIRNIFAGALTLGEVAPVKHGMSTGNNARFLRRWTEVGYAALSIGSSTRDEAASTGKMWFPYNKGGPYRKWYGNNEYVVNYQDNGRDMRHGFDVGTNRGFRHDNFERYFSKSLTWSFISSYSFAVRYCDAGFIFDVGGSSAFPDEGKLELVAGLLCSKLSAIFMQALNPTANMQVGNVASIPFLEDRIEACDNEISSTVSEAIALAKNDWDAAETSWDFQFIHILTASSDLTPTLESSYTAWIIQNRQTIAEMMHLEEENNRLFIDAYGLQDELTPEVPIEQITLTVNPAYRYGKKLADDEWSVEHGFGEELETRFREDTMQELVSYAIGCMMGRYSLDAPGLIYAHGGNQGFDPSRYARFPADADGILPITDTDWFDDDAAHRLVEFIAVAFGEVDSDKRIVNSGEKVSREENLSTIHYPLITNHLEENLAFLAANLSPKKDETIRETLRRYLSDRFFKEHLQTYKNRPIYWCFSSGKQKAFQCLVYLHRYHSGTLARMRMEYVVPLQSKMAARIDKLGDDIQAAGSSAQAKRLQKERDKLTKQLEELRRFDEQLRHYADQRIALDLDDGVKVNYGKFGNLLAEVKTVTGQKSD